MPFEIQLPYWPGGYALTDANAGESISVETVGFYSSQDGDILHSRLDGYPAQFLEAAKGAKHPSRIDNLFVVIRPDLSATVYVDEFWPTMLMRAKGRVEVGEGIGLDKILSIERLSLESLQLTEKCGVCYVFSHVWRKGLFFDFSPLDPKTTLLNWSERLEGTLARCWTQLLFQHLVVIPESAWSALFAQGWFPFIHLPQSSLKKMIGWASRGRNVDEYLDEVCEHLRAISTTALTEWAVNPVMTPHLDVFKSAVDRFLADDWIAAAHILYPRIEGLLRSQIKNFQGSLQPNQRNLSKAGAGVGHSEMVETSLLLPARFEEYLLKVYFAAFDPNASVIQASRNSVAHGVVSISNINKKAAAIALLTTLQIATVGSIISPRPAVVSA